MRERSFPRHLSDCHAPEFGPRSARNLPIPLKTLNLVGVCVQPDRQGKRIDGASMYQTRRPIYFLHIPKTAGSSVDRWLSERSCTEDLCTAKIWDQIVSIRRDDLQRFSVFSGHFGVDLAEFLGKDLTITSVFLDPTARTISHYRHVFRDANHPHNTRVSRQSFVDFVRDRDNWPMIENFQARYLIKSSIIFTQN